MRAARRALPLLTLLALVAAPSRAAAQEEGQPANDRLYLPVDAEAARDFERIDALQKRKQWDRVVGELDRLFHDGGAKLIERDEAFVTVRAEARRRLLALPEEGRQAYALTHETPARRLYEQGLEEPGTLALSELLSEHPASPLAPKAHELLASRYFERGEPGAALLQLEALLASPPPQADQTALQRARLACLAAMGRQGEAELALEELNLPAEEAQAEAALIHALQPAEPTPAPAAGAPLVWSRTTYGYYEGDAYQPPWTLPRADVAWLYAQDGSHAQALDLRTGKVAWRTPLNDYDAFARPRGLCRLALAQRAVVCVLPGSGGLVGLERQTGQVLWQRSLDALKAAAQVDFPAHLSGRPEVIGDVVVLCLVTEHEDHEVYTLAVDVRTGELAWSVFLASQKGGRTPLPFLTHGLQRIFVVTGLGATAALDYTGEILWLRRYRSKRDARRERRGPFPPGFGGQQERGPPERDPSALVTRGVLWAAPADAVGFLAWDARSGEPRAALTAPAGGRILAARAPGVLVLSNGGDLLSVTRAGAKLLLQVGGKLVGRPCAHGEQVFIPRQDGVVLADLAAKQVGLFSDWTTSGGPGNVLVAGGRLLVAAPRGVFGWGQPLPGGEAEPPLQALGAESFTARQAASAALLARGEQARPELTALLGESPDPEVRLRAQTLLGELDRQARLQRWTPLIKESWQAEVPDLLNRLTHPNPEVRLAALRRLGALQDEDVAALLHDLLEDADPRVRFNAGVALLQRGDRGGMEQVAAVLRGGHPADRLVAVNTLRNKGVVEDLPLLEPVLGAEEANLRAAAAQAMLKLGKARALDAVLPLMDDDEDEVRLAVLTGIEANGLDAKRAVRALAKAAQDANDQIRQKAVDALVRGGMRHPDVFQALGMALGDPIQSIAKQAGNRLFRMASQVNDDVLMIPPEGIEKGARLEDDPLRYYVAQIAILYAQEQLSRAREQAHEAQSMEAQAYHGARLLSVETLTRFMSDPVDQIRNTRIVGGPGWSGLLLERVKGQVLDKADVAAINSLSLSEAYDVRHNGYQALSQALEAPGRGRILAGALTDADERIREAAVDWLAPAQGDDLLDVEGLAKVIAVSLRGDDPERPGAAEAKKVLDRLQVGRLRTLLIPVLRAWPDPQVRAWAGARLAAVTAGEVPYDPQRAPGAMADAYAVWSWRQDHPGQQPEDLLHQLNDSNPSVRWRAAQSAVDLPVPLIRNGLIASLGTEQAEWVLKAKLEAAVAVTGQTLGFDSKLRGQQLRDCARRFQNWLSHKLLSEAGGGR